MQISHVTVPCDNGEYRQTIIVKEFEGFAVDSVITIVNKDNEISITVDGGLASWFEKFFETTDARNLFGLSAVYLEPVTLVHVLRDCYRNS